MYLFEGSVIVSTNGKCVNYMWLMCSKVLVGVSLYGSVKVLSVGDT